MNPEFEGLNLVELLDLLEPVPEPLSVPLTPQTPGWLVVGVVLAAVLFLGVRWGVRRHRRNAYRRAALKELDAAAADPAAIAAILRRTALSAFPRETVAGLHGAEWLAFLDRTYPGGGFAEGAGRVLEVAPYRPCPPVAGLEGLARDWVKRHQRSQAATT